MHPEPRAGLTTWAGPLLLGQPADVVMVLQAVQRRDKPIDLLEPTLGRLESIALREEPLLLPLDPLHDTVGIRDDRVSAHPSVRRPRMGDQVAADLLGGGHRRAGEWCLPWLALAGMLGHMQ